jgi:asparagine synthase (glutamine-hydrolysing)
VCGIAGQLALNLDCSVDMDELLGMVRAMAHRGPDDEGIFIDPRRQVALGMRRLAVIDLVTGKQPVFSEDGSVVCVFNGEIYNFQLLRTELERKGHIFQSMTDTEVVVHLYEEEGVDCLQRLRGMFALAIWDQRDATLMLARDRLGKKPLYYGEGGGRLSFASEIGALCGLRGLKREIDPIALDLYLTYSYIPAPYSIYRAVRKLPPGHFMTVRDGRAELTPYWRLRMSGACDSSRAEIARDLKGKVADAVQIRTVSDVPLGCFLSGGTDSSAVVALMSKVSTKPVKTFSIGFSHDQFNELEYARTVAKQYRTEHYEYIVEPDAIAVLPEMVRHFGEPFGDSSALPMWYLAKLARQHVTVALNGDGGDELFGGYPWYRTGLRLGQLAHALPGWLISAMAGTPPRLSDKVGRLGRRLQMSPGERFASLRQFLDPALKQRLYSKSLLVGCQAVAEQFLVERYEALGGSELARMQYTDIMTYLPEDLLVKVDRMTMAHSVEARSPLLDHELLEFCARIPSEMKVGAGGMKMIFREAMRDLFPPGFLDRRKMGFSIPVADWLREELREECYRRLCSGTLMEQGWFNSQAVRAMLDEHSTGDRDWSAQIWNLLMLAEWMETFGA